MLRLLLSLLLSNQFLSGAGSSLVAINENDVFDFDFTWQPMRPRANETVHFKAVGVGRPEMHRWGLTNASFRWYRQMPSTDYRLVHIGRRYSRVASDYFEGRYRLSVRMYPQLPQSDTQSNSWSSVDIVKYVGLQQRVRSVLIVRNRTDGRPGRRIACRFWGYPRVDSLQLSGPEKFANNCRTSSHFETSEAEPYIDLVSDCSNSWLPAGEYSCYGRNSIGASRLKCRLDKDLEDFLGQMKQCQEILAEEVNEAVSRQQGYQQNADSNQGVKLGSVAMGTMINCLFIGVFASVFSV